MSDEDRCPVCACTSAEYNAFSSLLQTCQSEWHQQSAAVETSKSKTWVVGHIEWGNNELILERVEAATWQEAVQKHSLFPFEDEDVEFMSTISEEDFRQRCFDCDSMMNWIEVTP